MSAQGNKIGERIKYKMDELGLNACELAKLANIKPSFIYDIMSGKSANPSIVKLADVAKVLNVELNYLIANDVLSRLKPVNDHASDSANPDLVSIPYIMVEASAGGGSHVAEETQGEPFYFSRSWIRQSLSCNPADLRAISVRGDSMEPTLRNKDTILVNITQHHPSPAGVFVLFDGYGLVAKRLEFVADSSQSMVRIISDNPQYTPYTRQIGEINIIGRIVWFAREVV